ncbi:MAG TPA: ABC transporter permease, partial [Cyclobacteriaceae bacterium]|nr:ABC transporter permease [Cyclobacteriaceae bacterium]
LMLKSYFLIGFRNLLKEKGYSFIKITGLTFGLSVSMIIFLYVQEDLSFDAFNKNYNRIVRLLTIDSAEGVSSKLVGVTQPRLGPAADEEIPEVIKSVRFTGGGRYDLSYEGNSLKCEQAYRVDPSVFDVFDIPVVKGATSGILDNPGSIAITESLAKKIFGDKDPIGQTVKLNLTTDLFVTAVLADRPKNSHLQFDLLHSLVPGQNEDGLRQALNTWQGIFCNTYLLLDKPTDIPSLNAKLQEISKKNNAFQFFTPVAQPLEDVHLKSKEILFEANANKSDALNVYVLSIIAALILVLASVNFMNLVTAKSAARAKEVGMRKVIGAVRSQLIGQHLTESIIVTSVAMVIAFILTYFSIPLLNNAYQRFADPSLLLAPQTLLILAGLVTIVGVHAGIYPAFVLSAFKPIMVLKGSFKNSGSGIQLRKVLVVLQFTISIALMVGTGVVYQQMQFIYSADLGYSRDQIISIQQSGSAVGRAKTLRTELLRNPNIVAAGTSSTRIGQQLGRTTIVPEGSDGQSNIIVSTMAADESFIPTMDMKMAAGRNFSLEFDDSLSMVINEQLMHLLKWNDAVGKKISLQSGPNPTDLTAYTVVGVVKDFHFATVRHKLEPMFMLYNENNGAMSIKIKAAAAQESIAHIEASWKKVNPGSTFEYAFLDDQFANLYRNERAFSKMFTHFTLLALFIAALGLFALSAFTAEQRKKEIGIRKVMGATNTSILIRLSSEFIQLIVIAFLLASVIAYFVMKQWLLDFQYRIDMPVGVFVVAGVGAVLIALFTVSMQGMKAAMANPAESLRTE